MVPSPRVGVSQDRPPFLPGSALGTLAHHCLRVLLSLTFSESLSMGRNCEPVFFFSENSFRMRLPCESCLLLYRHPGCGFQLRLSKIIANLFICVTPLNKELTKHRQ